MQPNVIHTCLEETFGFFSKPPNNIYVVIILGKNAAICVQFMSYLTLDEVSKLVPNLEYLFSFKFQLKNAATKFCFLGHLHAIKVP